MAKSNNLIWYEVTLGIVDGVIWKPAKAAGDTNPRTQFGAYKRWRAYTEEGAMVLSSSEIKRNVRYREYVCVTRIPRQLEEIPWRIPPITCTGNGDNNEDEGE